MTDRHKLKILLADDSPVVRKLLGTTLIKIGHEVIAVEDGLQAVEAFETHTFDLVLLDIIMPNMTGLEATPIIKQMAQLQQRWVPILIVSTLEDEKNIIKALNAGAEDFVAKNMHMDVLNAKIRAYARSIADYKQLQISEARARTISEGVLDAIITTDENGLIVSVNKATETIFGYPREELTSQSLLHILPRPPQEFNEHTGTEQTDDHDSGEQTRRREVVGVSKQGAFIDLSLGVSRISVEGEVLYINVLSDITDFKQKEAKLLENARHLSQLNTAIRMDMDMADQVMERMINKQELDDPHIRYYLKPADQFSGDLIAARRAPSSGQLHIMVADATGHGLAAAVSVLPVLWIFYGMVAKDMMTHEIAQEINARLKQLIPVGRYVAAHIITVDFSTHQCTLWSGGMPPAILLDESSGSCQLLPSQHPALGILPATRFDNRCKTFAWQTPHQLFLYSDGLIEAESESGKMFGEDRLLASIKTGAHRTALEKVLQAIEIHLEGKPPQDDISFLNVLLDDIAADPS